MEMEKCYIELILWYFSVSKSKKIIQLFAQFTCFKMVKCGCYIKKNLVQIPLAKYLERWSPALWSRGQSQGTSLLLAVVNWGRMGSVMDSGSRGVRVFRVGQGGWGLMVVSVAKVSVTVSKNRSGQSAEDHLQNCKLINKKITWGSLTKETKASLNISLSKNT